MVNNHKLWAFLFFDFNFNSVETLPDFELRAVFTIYAASVFQKDVDMLPTNVDYTLSYFS